MISYPKHRESSVSRPLRVGGILWCHVRVDDRSLFRVRAGAAVSDRSYNKTRLQQAGENLRDTALTLFSRSREPQQSGQKVPTNAPIASIPATNSCRGFARGRAEGSRLTFALR